MNESEKSVRHLLGSMARVGSLLAFVAFAGITAISVTYARNVLTRSIASENGVPRTWEKDSIAASKVKSEISASVIDGQFVQYVSSIKNADVDKAQYVTHLSSYFAEVNHAGYLDLNNQTIEYSYTPEDEQSWKSLNLAAPSAEENGFKLSTKLYIGVAGSVNDTIYFRYNVEPTEEVNDGVDATMNDTIAFKTMSEDGKVGVSQSAVTVAYAEVDNVAPADDVATVDDVTAAENVAPIEVISAEGKAALGETMGSTTADETTGFDEEQESDGVAEAVEETLAGDTENTEADACDTEAGCTEVLGVSSYVPSTQIISGVKAEEKVSSFAIVSFGFKMIIITLGALAVCYIVYLITNRDSKKVNR